MPSDSTSARLSLTLAIDVASRMVAGFYLTLEPPSALSVVPAIQHLESLGIDAD